MYIGQTPMEEKYYVYGLNVQNVPALFASGKNNPRILGNLGEGTPSPPIKSFPIKSP